MQRETSTLEYPERALQDVKNPAFASFLNFSRWLAASIVFLGHLRNPLFLGFSDVPPADRGPAVKLWYFVTGWHAEAVVVFFVLSGFLVGGLSVARIRAGTFSLWNYSIDRLTRLYIPFLPALLLTVLADHAGSTWFGETGLYNHLHPMIQSKVTSAPFEQGMTATVLIKNIFMLQHLAVVPYGSNQPLWSVSYEFWFYLIFAIWLAVSTSGSLLLRSVGVAGMFGVAALLGGAFFVHSGLWLVGASAVYLRNPSVERPLLSLVTFIATMIVARLAGDLLDGNNALRTLKNYAVALSFVWLLISLRNTDFAVFKKTGRFNQLMADFSYSLYLIHFPVMLVMMAALYHFGHFGGLATGYSPAQPEGILIYIWIAASVYALAFLFARLTEHQTVNVRHLMKQRIVPVQATQTNAQNNVD
jgi:peptidoglycan/LPS O-acetylase OafA/YrhL